LERNVSSTHTDGGGGGSGGSSLVDKVKGGTYSDAQWGGLTPAERERVSKYRKEAASKKKGKAKARAKKRKLAKAKSARQKDDDEGSEEEAPTRPQSDAGAQFGSNGSKKKKS
jgi:hypothetical protein